MTEKADPTHASPSRAARALTLHPKVAAGGLGGSVSVIVLYCIDHYAHQDLPVEVGAAITWVISTACGWLAPGASATLD